MARDPGSESRGVIERSFEKFSQRLGKIGLRDAVEKRSLSFHVTLRDLYEAPAPGTQSVTAARRAVYVWLMTKGKSGAEIAKLFDRSRSGVLKLTRDA